MKQKLMKLSSVLVATAMGLSMLLNLPSDTFNADWALNVSAEIVPDCLVYTITDGEVAITDCDTSASGALEIPATIEGYPVTSIGAWAFYRCSALTSITIQDGVASIGNYAFYYCSSLTSITIPSNVVSIGKGTFSGCTDVIIYGETGSYAETYANVNNLPFVAVSTATPNKECTDISCTINYMGGFYADDQTAIASDDLVIIATMSDGATLDITADCAVEDDVTPYSLYWDAYNAGNPTFEFTADFVYDGENEAVLAYLEGMGTDVVYSVALNIGQRGDVSLDHVADNYDASMIQKYLVDYSSYETLLQFGVVTDEPILNEENNEFALILSDCDANGEHVAGDAALLLKWEADSAEYALVQEFAGNIVTPADLALLWADILT